MFLDFQSADQTQNYCKSVLKKYSTIILYGYSDIGHTHHWIMVALEKALLSLATKSQSVIMLSKSSEFSEEIFENSIVFGNINQDNPDENMPIIDSADYIIHDHNPGRFESKRERYSKSVKNGRCVFYRVFRKYSGPEDPFERILNYEAHEWSRELKMLSIPWATNLLPNELPKKPAYPVPENRDVVFVGTIWKPNENQISELAKSCTRHGLRFVHYGKNFSGYKFPDGANVISSQDYISEEEHQKVISKAFLAPAIQAIAQIGNNPLNGSYVPCRLLKNVSYLSLPVSNNLYIKPFLGGSAVVSQDIDEMIRLSMEVADDRKMRESMIGNVYEIIREKHTYISRIATMLQALETSE